MPVTFTLAGPTDEADIRRLLRDNPFPGRWSIALTREPDGMGGPHWPGERRHFVLARDKASGEAVGLCERVVRPAFVDGAQRLVPYLGALRIAASHRRRIAILKGGFAALRAVEQPDECPFAMTSIAADNAAASRILTAGIGGLPIYRPVGGMVTRMIRARPMRRETAIAELRGDELDEAAHFLRDATAHRQFAPAWTAAALAQPGLHLLALREGGAIVGTVGLWDQRASRQAVLHAMPRLLGVARPLANPVARMAGLPPVPRPGSAIDQAFVCCLACPDEAPHTAIRLTSAAIDLAARSGIAVATLGLPEDRGWLPAMRGRFRAIEYATRLYAVHWPDEDHRAVRCDQGQVFPEIALL